MLKRNTYTTAGQSEYSKETLDEIHYGVQKLNERLKQLNASMEEGHYGSAYTLLHSLQHRANVLKTTFSEGE